MGEPKKSDQSYVSKGQRHSLNVRLTLTLNFLDFDAPLSESFGSQRKYAKIIKSNQIKSNQREYEELGTD